MGVPATVLELSGSSGVVVDHPTIYRGLVAVETGGENGATVVVHDGVDDTGPIIDAISLDAEGAGSTDRHPVQVTTGIYVDVTGAVAGSVFIA